MVIAICTACKKQIEVDPAIPAVLCSHCNQPIATEAAIKEYMLNTFGHLLPTAPAATNDPLFQIEDGELTLYKGNKTEIKVPAGVRVIGSGAFKSCNATKIFLPASVEHIRKDALSGQIIFEDGCVLKSVEENAFADARSLINFPKIAPGCYRGYGWFCTFGRSVCLFTKSSREEFFSAYPHEDLKSYEFFVFNRREPAQHTLVFDFIKCVETDDGWHIAIGKNEATVYGYSGMPKDTLVMPDECEGVPVTEFQNETWLQGYLPNELFLSKNLKRVLSKKIPHYSKMYAKIIHIPSGLKYIGHSSLHCEEVCFDTRDGIPYSEVEKIENDGIFWQRGADIVIAPYLKNKPSGFIAEHFKTEEEYNAIVALKREKAAYDMQRHDVRFIPGIYKDGSHCEITITNKFETLTYKMTNTAITLPIHLNDTVTVTVSNPFVGTSSQTAPTDITECTVKETFFSWKLVCK